jgi:hypothetical protein
MTGIREGQPPGQRIDPIGIDDMVIAVEVNQRAGIHPTGAAIGAVFDDTAIKVCGTRIGNVGLEVIGMMEEQIGIGRDHN